MLVSVSITIVILWMVYLAVVATIICRRTVKVEQVVKQDVKDDHAFAYLNGDVS
jgi:hypothetical protein